MAATTKGYPYPDGPDEVDVPGDIQTLAEAVDLAPGTASLTQTQIDALSAPQKWAGRVVWNSTASKLQVSNGSTFSDVNQGVNLSSSTPQATASAGAAGTSGNVSRADHVHATGAHASTHATGGSDALAPSDIGAVPTTRTVSSGNGLSGGGDLSANRTLSVDFASSNPVVNGTAAAGVANTASRGDHVHPTDTSRAALASPTFTGTPAAPTASVDTNTTQVATTAFVLGQAASANPVMDGTAAAGTSTRYARADHVHASDTSRIANSTVDAAGDLLVGSADNTVGRLALGANGAVLTVDTAGSGVNKVKWAAVPAPISPLLLMGA